MSRGLRVVLRDEAFLAQVHVPRLIKSVGSGRIDSRRGAEVNVHATPAARAAPFVQVLGGRGVA